MSMEERGEQTDVAFRIQDNRAAPRELAKDAQQLMVQSGVLWNAAQSLRLQQQWIRVLTEADDELQSLDVTTERLRLVKPAVIPAFESTRCAASCGIQRCGSASLSKTATWVSIINSFRRCRPMWSPTRPPS